MYSVKKKIKYIPPDKDIEAVKEICTLEQLFLLEFVNETAARINEPLHMYGKDVLEDYVILHTRKSKNSDIVPRKIPKPNCIQGKKFLSDERVFPYWNDYPKFLARKLKY